MSEEDKRKLEALKGMLPRAIAWRDVLEAHDYKFLRLTLDEAQWLRAHLLDFHFTCESDVVTTAFRLKVITKLNAPSEESRLTVLELALKSALDGWESWVKGSPTPAETVNAAVLDHIAAVRKALK